MVYLSAVYFPLDGRWEWTPVAVASALPVVVPVVLAIRDRRPASLRPDPAELLKYFGAFSALVAGIAITLIGLALPGIRIGYCMWAASIAAAVVAIWIARASCKASGAQSRD